VSVALVGYPREMLERHSEAGIFRWGQRSSAACVGLNQRNRVKSPMSYRVASRHMRLCPGCLV
jgi:hypothetical protein